MYASSVMRWPKAAIILGGVALSALAGNAPAADVQGFIVSHIAYALSKDANETGACPDGMTKGYGHSSGFTDIGDVFVTKQDLQRHDGEVEDKYVRRVFGQAMSD